MNQITNIKAKTNQKLGSTHQIFKSGILSLFAAHSHLQTNKRGLSADSLSLFLSALRPRLLRFWRKISAKIRQKWPKSIKLNKKFAQNSQFSLKNVKNYTFLYEFSDNSSNFALKILKFSQNSRRIVAVSIILGVFGLFFAKNTPVSAASLTLSVPSSLSLNISPATSPSGFFAKSPTPGKISISTDNSSGYTLSIKAKTDNNLSLAGSSTTSKLSSISTSLTEDQYKSSGNINTWAYMPSKLEGIDNANFLPGPTLEGSTIDATESANTESNDYDLTLAAKVDSSIPAGSYTNTFIVSALANEPKIQTMQNWAANADNCANLPDGQILNLQDTRDESIYRVAKLADGKCWMIDNLKIVNKKITSADSDVSSDFTIPASSISGFSDSNYNGDWAYYGGTKDSGGDDYGVHYSWHVATAGAGTQSMSSGDATSSICPKGWRLPKGGPNGDFVALDKAMGGDGANRFDATARDRFIKKPIPGFTYAGGVRDSILYNQGDHGAYWSSTATSTSNAFSLLFYTHSGVYPFESYYKSNGASVRCIAREPEPSPELLTQQWTADADEINVSVGKGIEMIMIADGSDNWKPYYAFPGKDVNLSGTNGKKYIISVVPEANKVMTKLNKENGKISATGGNGSYPSMQDFSQCTAAGTNVTDTRNNVSYTVALIGSRCWMLSNLRLAAGTVLNSSTSNVSSNFTLPTTTWTNDYNNPIMKECKGYAGNDAFSNNDCNKNTYGVTEYYYNWTAAKANTSSVDSGGYSICPKNWILPNYDNDITAANAWNSGANPGMLATVGTFLSGTQYLVGSDANWWSTTRYSSSDNGAYYLYFLGTSATRDYFNKYYGVSVRCMR